jgi:cell wall-associated NlpC family hydrolase
MRVLAALAVAACAATLAFAPAAHSQTPKRSWAQPQIEQVLAAGLFPDRVRTFRPEQPLTRRDLAGAFPALALQLGRTKGYRYALRSPEQPVTIRELNAALVGFVGLGEAARTITAQLRTAGLAPKAGAGTETVARLLGLRYNHPDGSDALELGPNDTATRAEAAYSLARVLQISATEASAIQQQAATFMLPELTDWQRQILRRAVSFIGYPYVWGGTSEFPQQPLGKPTPGGFDCSGFIWRVFKLEPFAGASALATVLRGRSTYELAGEIGLSMRVRKLESLQPADVIFQGDGGLRSLPSQVGHAGIYLGGGWFAHSSRNGTTLHPLDGWYRERFAWARRPLREAGLA